MTQRQLVCACEDVTAGDVQTALRHGYTDLESLKRYTGVGTGICQGRSCIAQAVCMLRAHEMGGARPGLAPVRVPTTARPPLFPTRLGQLAAGEALPPLFPGPQAPARTVHAPSAPAAPLDLPPLPKRASIVIVGGGIMGMATAYHLARLGQKDVLVLERSYLNAGASGRNGGGMRAQWSTELNVGIMLESFRLARNLAAELKINTWLRQGGYLFLLHKAQELEAAQQRIVMQNRLGVPTRLLTPKQCRGIVPQLQLADTVGGTYNPHDAVIFPWPLAWGYSTQAQRRGVQVATFTPVTGVDVQAGRIRGVHTPRGTVQCELMINAAAAWSADVAQLCGVQLPNYAQRHEIMVTESFKPFLDPLVSELSSGLYFSQSMRGEIVAGLGDPLQTPGLQMRSSLRFSVRIARALCARMPALAGAQVIRQWAGCYDVTPDGNPILGEVDGVAGMFMLSGFVGHGFMMAPAVSRRVASLLVQGKSDPIFHAYRPQRFAAGAEPLPAESMIIG